MTQPPTQPPPPSGPPPQPPYGVPSGYPPGQPPLPQKRRPSAGWFVAGIGLLLAAAAAAVGLFIWTLSGFLETDASLLADGQPHRVTVATDGDRMLWLPGSDGRCRVVDLATGAPVHLRPVGGSYERSDSHGDLRGAFRFDPGSGRLSVACITSTGATGDEVVIGPSPRIASFVVGILATIFVPLLLGLAGLAVLIVTGILWATRPARPRP